MSSTLNFLGETFILELVYGITATGPDGLPALSWSGSISRPLFPGSPLPVIPVRLFNVWDYDVCDTSAGDSATVSQTVGPSTTLVDIMGQGGIDGQRGVYGAPGYTVDTLGNVLAQIQVNNDLNDTGAPGTYDVAGAFQWNWDLCSDPQLPQCPAGGTGSGGFGDFGSFGASESVPEPSTGLLLSVSLLCRRRGAAVTSTPLRLGSSGSLTGS